MSTGIYLNIHHILLACWRRRYLIAWPVLVMPFLVLVVGMLTPKTYVSHTTMLIQETSRLNPFMQDFAISTQLEQRISALSALLHSRHILLKVAKDSGLIEQENSERSAAVVQRLSDALQVQLIGTDMIKITFSSNEPADMAKILNAVSTHFLETLLAPEQSSMQGSESFLESQIKSQQQDLQRAEQALADFKKQYSSSLPDQYNFDVQQLRASENLLLSKKNELAGAKAALDSFNTQLLKTNPVLASIEQEMIASQARLSQLQSRYTEQHSQVIAEQQNLQRLKDKRDALVKDNQQLKGTDIEQLWQLASGLQQADDPNGHRTLLVSQLEALQSAKSKFSQLEQETQQLEQVVLALKNKLDAFAAIELQLGALERDIGTKRNIYNDLLKRHEQARVTMALGQFEQHDRVKIIDPPFVPYRAVNLPLAVYAVLGLVSGLCLAGVLVLLTETLDSSITRREVVSQICGAPVLSRLPDFTALQPEQPSAVLPVGFERRSYE